MIITRSPLRISFAGGGTDIPAFYKNNGWGMVVSTAIDKHVYVTFGRKFDGKVSIRYRIHEMVDDVSQIRHPLIKAALLLYGIKSGIEMVVMSDVPARGSGLGASSALACALVAALELFVTGEMPAKEKIAETASKIEIELVKSPIGKQDHYASAFGDFNKFTFNDNEIVDIESFGLTCFGTFLKMIEKQSILFYLNIEHKYSDQVKGGNFVQKILSDQISAMDEKTNLYKLQRDNAREMWNNLNYENVERFADHVNENWRLKRDSHADVSNKVIDKVIQRAFSAGAVAAKVCGAGGGGFVYFLVPEIMREKLVLELSELKELPFRFSEKGTEVLFMDEKKETAYAEIP